ncbi:type II toxin-antitoxin system Phd/YefM family antitoxin [candidate division KSB1 bacterium]|nr:type II toxin-antitoxin system Phd/YefM family antitoxin [candidate division KSB1 bacterium]
MKASIVDLRYRMKEVLNALENNERVQVTYHGKLKGIIIPVEETTVKSVKDHPFFRMNEGDTTKVDELMSRLRKGRYNAF